MQASNLRKILQKLFKESEILIFTPQDEFRSFYVLVLFLSM
jgi:hypothetical protein